MEIIQNISALLAKKLTLFLEFERYTNTLTKCDIDAMADYITKRLALANEIDVVTGQISDLCKAADVVPPAKDIISNHCDYSGVPPQWQPIFLQAQQILATVSRSIDVNEQVLQRMTDLRAYFKSRIEDTNNAPRIIQYLSSSGAIQQERDISIRNQQI